MRAFLALRFAALALTLGAAAAPAQSLPGTFVRIAPRVPGVVWQPPAGATHKSVAVVVMHDNNDFLDHPATQNLAARGFTVISANPRYAPDVDDRDIDWYAGIADLGAAVKFARAQAGITRVVLLGHSSGAALAASYQNIAENGVAACRGPAILAPCPASLAGLPKADAVVLLDPILGLGANFVTSVDPMLSPGVDKSQFDLLAPGNGFTPRGATYSPEFRRRFLQEAAKRNAALIAQAQARVKAVDEGRAAYADDEPFIVPGGTRTPRLWRPDLSMLEHTREPHLLLKGDGTNVTQIVHTVRVPSGLSRATPDRNDREAGKPADAVAAEPDKPLLAGGSLVTTARRFLSTFATRTTADYDIRADDITGIDWNSSATSVPGNLEGVHAPLLILGMTGHYWIVSSEIAFRHAASADKSLAYVEGATHGMTPCQPCERRPGEFGNTTARTFDQVAAWLKQRF